MTENNSSKRIRRAKILVKDWKGEGELRKISGLRAKLLIREWGNQQKKVEIVLGDKNSQEKVSRTIGGGIRGYGEDPNILAFN